MSRKEKRVWMIGLFLAAFALRLLFLSAFHDRYYFSGITLQSGEAAWHLSRGEGYAQDKAMMDAMARAGACRLTPQQMDELARSCIQPPAKPSGHMHAVKEFVGAEPHVLAGQVGVRAPSDCRPPYGPAGPGPPTGRPAQGKAGGCRGGGARAGEGGGVRRANGIAKG